ncbi:MAG: hypothetical protein WCD37_17605 [Chloroflexia bacterium]
MTRGGSDREQKSSPALAYMPVGVGIAMIFFFVSWPTIDYAKDSLPTIVALLDGGM